MYDSVIGSMTILKMILVSETTIFPDTMIVGNVQVSFKNHPFDTNTIAIGSVYLNGDSLEYSTLPTNIYMPLNQLNIDTPSHWVIMEDQQIFHRLVTHLQHLSLHGRLFHQIRFIKVWVLVFLALLLEQTR